MDEIQREYLDAVNKIAEEHKPTMLPLTDELVWLEISKCLFNNPSAIDSNTNNHLLKVSDWFLVEFKKRFRNHEESN